MAFVETGVNPKTGAAIGYNRTHKDQYPSNKKKGRKQLKIKKKGY
jgi:hypothetical protein